MANPEPRPAVTDFELSNVSGSPSGDSKRLIEADSPAQSQPSCAPPVQSVPSSKMGFPSLFGLFKDVGAVIAVGAAILYAAGFIIVNTHYSRLGIPPTFVGGRCIAAAAFPVGSALLGIILAVLASRLGENFYDATYYGYMAGATVLTATYLVSLLVWGFEPSPFRWTSVWPRILLLAGVGVIPVSMNAWFRRRLSRVLAKIPPGLAGADREHVLSGIRDVRRVSDSRMRQAYYVIGIAFAPLAIDLVVRAFGLKTLGPPSAMSLALPLIGATAGAAAYPTFRRRLTTGIRGAAASLGASVLFLALLFLYGAFVYPTVPAALGGGKFVLLNMAPSDFDLDSLVGGHMSQECLGDTPRVFFIDIVGPYVLLSIQPHGGPARIVAVHQDRISHMVFPDKPWLVLPSRPVPRTVVPDTTTRQ